MSEVDGIEFTEAQQAINTYPIATLTDSKNPALAKAFVDYVLSPEGQAVLAKAGLCQALILSQLQSALAERHRDRRRPWQSRVPLLLAAPAAVALLFLVLPLVGLVMRAPWADAGAVLTSEGALQACGCP